MAWAQCHDPDCHEKCSHESATLLESYQSSKPPSKFDHSTRPDLAVPEELIAIPP
jgi:hypothetical protein